MEMPVIWNAIALIITSLYWILHIHIPILSLYITVNDDTKLLMAEW